jgi:hypothetical protein
MEGPLRRGGRLVDVHGAETTWSVAEGRRGRRWRWTATDRGGGFVAAHTLELDPEGRFGRLESVTGGGLLTLHRESDGSLHGNRVTGGGIDHLVIPAPAPELVIVGSGPLGLAALAGGDRLAVAAALDVVEIRDDLGVRVAGCRVERPEARTWELHSDRATWRATVDNDGLPTASGAGRVESWPLESD